MAQRFHSLSKKGHAVRRDSALRRPEQRRDAAFGRVPSAGLTSAPVKVIDAATRRLIDDALAAASMPTSRSTH
jgi:hypothetical protein